MFLPALERFFPGNVRARANDYLRFIRILERDERVVHGHIRGATDYCLRLELHDRTLGVACSCPYFESSGPCKHLWALLEHVQRTGSFGHAQEPNSLIALVPQPHQRAQPSRVAPTAVKVSEAPWKKAIASLREPFEKAGSPLPPGAEIAYVIDIAASLVGRGAYLDISMRTPKRGGGLSKPKPIALRLSAIPTLTHVEDRELLPILAAIAGPRGYSSYTPEMPSRVVLDHGSATSLLVKVLATGRAHLRISKGDVQELAPVKWMAGDPYVFHLVVDATTAPGELLVGGEFRRGDVVRSIADHLLAFEDGIVVFRDHAARLTVSPVGYRAIRLLQSRGGALHVPADDGEALALELRALPGSPPVVLPPSLQVDELRIVPQPMLQLRSPPQGAFSTDLIAELKFDYAGLMVVESDPRERIAVADRRSVIVRDLPVEDAARKRLLDVGCNRDARERAPEWSLPYKRLGFLAMTLGAEGWRVEADGKLFRTPGAMSIAVSSGIDWFDLKGHVTYGELRASLPELLAASRRGERFVRLADGSLGLLPEEWLSRHKLIGEMGLAKGDSVRFVKNQLGVLDALLSALPEASIDQQLSRARSAIGRFEGIGPVDAPKGFVGTLRHYQREGLGWLGFLRDFGFGGCLADDMGLGKTIQVLALLEGRRCARAAKPMGPSLVVVPKSLIFNWRREAARFTPKLEVMEHHGPQRARLAAQLSGAGVIVTTYGTLVRDIAIFREVAFDYVILDEAQAIKNPRTDAAKAARLLESQHRLALTGTPIENRLSDLWSLFEFLNPGMLGAASAFKRLSDLDPEESHDDASSRAVLAQALRPFILRRSKEQVATDLPPKIEQTIYCELEGDERRRYDELRAHYRATLLGTNEKKSGERSQMHILEALLRLRQAACHPGLLDREQADEPSAKLSALLAQLEDVIAGGHKALVFSQFTSLLAIVRKHLDAKSIAYAYLDGRTRDRQGKVDQFQTDASVPIFLISLKAGGVGLNLTAAEYVFLLDPWWNPAVEAQAIDRTHRIGQSNPVIAYRLIGRDTIEEKVIALQAQKRDLADTIINADNAILSRIGRDELDLLLS